MAAGTSFGEFLQDQLGSLGHVTVRRMFGGAGVYCDGLMFGLVSDDTLYFRVDDGNRGDSTPLEGTGTCYHSAGGEDYEQYDPRRDEAPPQGARVGARRRGAGPGGGGRRE